MTIMNKWTGAILLFALSLPAVADDKLYEPQHLTGRRLETVCSLAERMGTQIIVRSVPELKVVQISGPLASVEKAEALLKRFDVPQPPSIQQAQPQINFTIYLVRASMTAPSPDPKPRDMPPELGSVVAEMKRSFAYAHYNLLDTLVSPVNNSVTLQGVLPRFYSNSVQAYFYTLQLVNVHLAEDKTISVQPFSFLVKVPYIAGNETKEGASGVTTNLQLKAGQKMVVGKVNLFPTGDTDVFLVLTANY
jgi:hypothetical protein